MSLPRLFVIGDSISIHYGPYLEQYVQGQYQYARKQGTELALQNLDVPQGANGGDSSHVLEFLRMMQANGGIEADVLLLNCGLHDIKTDPGTGEKQVTPEHYEANLRSIIEITREMGLMTVWVRTTPVDESVHNHEQSSFYRFAADGEMYNVIGDAVMRAHEVPFVDLYTFTCNLGPGLYCDHVHFHEHIRAKQAAYIAGWLQAYRT